MRTLPPFIKILPFVIVGILLGQVVTLTWWVAVISAAVCTLVGYRLRHKPLGEVYMAVSITLWALCTTTLRTPRTIPTPKTPDQWETIITSHPVTSGRWQRCDAELFLKGGSEKIILQVDTASTIKLGQRGTLYGYLNPLPEGSYGALMQRRGYVGQLWATDQGDWKVTGEQSSPLIYARSVQQQLVGRIERLNLPKEEEAVVEAMLLGWRGDISKELRDSYSRAGSSHLLAISGLHVGIVAMLIWWLCWLLPLSSRRGHIIRNLVAIGAMLLYGVVTGLSPSVVRATIMFCVAQVALIYGSRRSALNLLSGAAAVMLIVNPNNLFDISFLLSVVAVMGIALGMEPTMRLLGGEGGGRMLRSIRGVVVVGLCSTIATLPLVAPTFGTVSLVGIFLNPFVIVTAEIIVLMGFIWVTLPLEFLEPLFRSVVGGAAWLQNRMVEVAADLSWAAIDVELPGWMVAVGYLLLAIGIVVAMCRKEKRECKIKI